MSRTKASEVVHRWRIFGASWLGNFGPGGKPCVVLLGIFNGKELNSKSTPALKAQIMLDGNSSLSEILKCFYSTWNCCPLREKSCAADSLPDFYTYYCSCVLNWIKDCVSFSIILPHCFFLKMQFSLYKYRMVKLSGDRPKTYLATGLYN